MISNYEWGILVASLRHVRHLDARRWVDPEHAVRRMLRSYYAQTALVLDIVCEIAAAEGTDRSREKSLSRRLSKLNDSAVAIEGQLPEDSADGRTLKAPPDQLPVFILDVLLSVETIVAAGQHLAARQAETPTDVERALLAALRTLREAFRARPTRRTRGVDGRSRRA